MPSQPVPVEQKSAGVNTGLLEGAKWGVGALIPAVAASFAANKYSAFYRTKFSPSAKIATPLMVSVFFFSMMSERTMFRVANDKQPWGYSRAGQEVAKAGRYVAPMHHKVINWLYDNPFKFIVMAGVPLVGTILKQQLQVKHLKLQQRIMHSRIFGQGGVLIILLVTMGFRNYMDKHGRFPDEYDEVGSAEGEEEVAAVGQK